MGLLEFFSWSGDMRERSFFACMLMEYDSYERNSVGKVLLSAISLFYRL